VSEDVSVLEEARAFCQKLAGQSAVAVEAADAAVRMALNSPLAAGLVYENEVNTLCLSAGEHVEETVPLQKGTLANFK
jgi:hypothetical protein